MIPQKKKYYTIDYREIVVARLNDVLKLNETLQDVPYHHCLVPQ
jgi:hypothetical protein